MGTLRLSEIKYLVQAHTVVNRSPDSFLWDRKLKGVVFGISKKKNDWETSLFAFLGQINRKTLTAFLLLGSVVGAGSPLFPK